jgi:hypothetical protein
METDEILNYAVKLFAMLLMALISLLIKKLQSYLTEKATENNAAELAQLITDFVAAAEQTLKADDPDGSKRLAYVEKLISAAGYELTDVVRSKIESAVYALNQSSAADSK